MSVLQCIQRSSYNVTTHDVSITTYTTFFLQRHHARCQYYNVYNVLHTTSPHMMSVLQCVQLSSYNVITHDVSFTMCTTFFLQCHHTLCQYYNVYNVLLTMSPYMMSVLQCVQRSSYNVTTHDVSITMCTTFFLQRHHT